jgi:tetratricopeptide (TPR) repeat protein
MDREIRHSYLNRHAHSGVIPEHWPSRANRWTNALDSACPDAHRLNERAVELFELAVGADSGFAPAYVGLAKAYLDRVDDLRDTREWLDQAIAAGEKAIELDPKVGDAYLPLGAAYSLQAAAAAGWRYATLAARDRLFENVQGDHALPSPGPADPYGEVGQAPP